MSTSNVPADLRYTKDHEWARKESDGTIRVGITAFAVDQLGDITLVELPKVGTVLETGKAFGTVESVKTLSDLFAPIAGTVVAINEALASQPELVNAGAYDKGWMVVLKPASAAELDALLDAGAYKTHLDGLDH
ncbi:MAG: glycine cleavage system protein GcvH [Polyangiales bacterium]